MPPFRFLCCVRPPPSDAMSQATQGTASSINRRGRPDPQAEQSAPLRQNRPPRRLCVGRIRPCQFLGLFQCCRRPPRPAPPVVTAVPPLRTDVVERAQAMLHGATAPSTPAPSARRAQDDCDAGSEVPSASVARDSSEVRDRLASHDQESPRAHSGLPLGNIRRTSEDNPNAHFARLSNPLNVEIEAPDEPSGETELPAVAHGDVQDPGEETLILHREVYAGVEVVQIDADAAAANGAEPLGAPGQGGAVLRTPPVILAAARADIAAHAFKIGRSLDAVTHLVGRPDTLEAVYDAEFIMGARDDAILKAFANYPVEDIHGCTLSIAERFQAVARLVPDADGVEKRLWFVIGYGDRLVGVEDLLRDDSGAPDAPAHGETPLREKLWRLSTRATLYGAGGELRKLDIRAPRIHQIKPRRWGGRRNRHLSITASSHSRRSLSNRSHIRQC